MLKTRNWLLITLIVFSAAASAVRSDAATPTGRFSAGTSYSRGSQSNQVEGEPDVGQTGTQIPKTSSLQPPAPKLEGWNWMRLINVVSRIWAARYLRLGL
jgi:hypothetical protein